jgi:hypothetical protein
MEPVGRYAIEDTVQSTGLARDGSPRFNKANSVKLLMFDGWGGPAVKSTSASFARSIAHTSSSMNSTERGDAIQTRRMSRTMMLGTEHQSSFARVPLS